MTQIGGVDVIVLEEQDGRVLRFQHPNGECLAIDWTIDGEVRGWAVTTPSSEFAAERVAAQASADAAAITAAADRQAAQDAERVEWAKRVGLLDAQGNPIRGGP